MKYKLIRSQSSPSIPIPHHLTSCHMTYELKFNETYWSRDCIPYPPPMVHCHANLVTWRRACWMSKDSFSLTPARKVLEASKKLQTQLFLQAPGRSRPVRKARTLDSGAIWNLQLASTILQIVSNLFLKGFWLEAASGILWKPPTSCEAAGRPRWRNLFKIPQKWGPRKTPLRGGFWKLLGIVQGRHDWFRVVTDLFNSLPHRARAAINWHVNRAWQDFANQEANVLNIGIMADALVDIDHK